MIIPAHDAAGTIAATIASLASEVDIIAEILVVDDGSSDDTADFAEKAGRDHGLPVTITRIGRLNAGAARNAGMALAAAPWLYFLDADDLHLEGGLRCLLRQALQAGNTDLVLGGYIRKLEGTVRTIDAADGYGISCMDNAENYLIDRRETINIGSALIRASAVTDKTFAETLPYEEDTLFWARLLTKSPVAKVGRAVMAYNISRDRSDERLMVSPVSRFFAWRRALRELAKFDIRETILRRREGLVAIKIARVHCRRGDFRMARKFLLLAWPAPKDLWTRWRYWRYRIKVFWKFA